MFLFSLQWCHDNGPHWHEMKITSTTCSKTRFQLKYNFILSHDWNMFNGLFSPNQYHHRRTHFQTLQNHPFRHQKGKLDFCMSIIAMLNDSTHFFPPLLFSISFYHFLFQLDLKQKSNALIICVTLCTRAFTYPPFLSNCLIKRAQSSKRCSYSSNYKKR